MKRRNGQVTKTDRGVIMEMMCLANRSLNILKKVRKITVEERRHLIEWAEETIALGLDQQDCWDVVKGVGKGNYERWTTPQ